MAHRIEHPVQRFARMNADTLSLRGILTSLTASAGLMQLEIRSDTFRAK